MLLGLSLRVSWICLLLFSSGACFPATKGDYKYPYTVSRLSGGGSAPGSSNLQSGGSRSPLVSLQHEPSANLQQPSVPVQQASSPTGNQSPFSLGGSSPSYQPNRFLITYDSSAPVIAVDSSSAGYVSPPVGTGKKTGWSQPPVGTGKKTGWSQPPVGTGKKTGWSQPPVGSGKKTPSFSVQSQPAVGSSGSSNMGSYSPVYEAASSSSAYPAGNTGYASSYPAATGGLYDAPVAVAAPDNSGGPVPYSDPFSDGSLSWDRLPGAAAASPGFPSAGAAYDPSAWMPSRNFPDFIVWDEELQGGSQETSPLPPSSYIIQSRNGYQRARYVKSHTRYSPEFPQPPVFRSKGVKGPSKSAPGSKGGRKV